MSLKKFFFPCLLTALIAVASPSRSETVGQTLDRWYDNTVDTLTLRNDTRLVDTLSPVGSPFTRQLYSEYQRLSKSANSELMALKAIEAAKGNEVYPEKPDMHTISSDVMPELEVARARLLKALDLGTRELIPVESAKAQAAFDCWVLAHSNYYGCHGLFSERIAKLEEMVGKVYGSAVNKSASPQDPNSYGTVVVNDYDASAPQAVNADNVFIVYFKSGATRVSEHDDFLLNQAAERFRAGGVNKILVSGFADTTGNPATNMILSQKRADHVREMLVRKGVPDAMIIVEARGEGAAQTHSSDPSMQRRVEITFL